MGFATRVELPYFAHREWPTDRRRAGGDLAHATHCAKFRLIEVSIGTYSFPYGHAFGVDDAAISAEERSTVMLFERNDRRVCEHSAMASSIMSMPLASCRKRTS